MVQTGLDASKAALFDTVTFRLQASLRLRCVSAHHYPSVVADVTLASLMFIV
jgi:hypothetical protein